MEKQIENQARNYWDKTWNRFLKFHGMIAPSAKLVQHLFNHVPRNGIILDLGCGEGRNSLYLSQVGYNIVGIDLSFKAARVMRNNFFEEELKGLVITGDARSLPFANDSICAILAHHIFDHLDANSFNLALDESFRVLKCNGVILLTMDGFDELANDKNAVIRDDKSIVFIKGTKKGMLIRPYQEDELSIINERGWKIIFDDLTPKNSKILMLQKCSIDC